jgi:hypothetical protein
VHFYRLPVPICSPKAPDAAVCRKELLSQAAAVSPRLGEIVLPRALQPLQENRITAEQVLQLLTIPVSNTPHTVSDDLCVSVRIRIGSVT